MAAAVGCLCPSDFPDGSVRLLASLRAGNPRQELRIAGKATAPHIPYTESAIEIGRTNKVTVGTPAESGYQVWFFWKMSIRFNGCHRYGLGLVSVQK
jgi:hypothetical protein